MCRSQDYNNNTFLIKISSLTDEKNAEHSTDFQKSLQIKTSFVVAV